MIQDHRIGSVRPERIDIDVGFDPGQFYHPEKTIRLCHTCASQERKISVDLDTHFGTRLAFCDIVGIVGITEAGKSGCYPITIDRKSTRLNSSHVAISYAVFCLKKKR